MNIKDLKVGMRVKIKLDVKSYGKDTAYIKLHNTIATIERIDFDEWVYIKNPPEGVQYFWPNELVPITNEKMQKLKKRMLG